MLRDPVERAYSGYQNELRNGRETLSFEDAIRQEMERLNGEVEKILNNRNYYSFNHQHNSYLARGIYVRQLERWLQYFSREQVMIIKSEDFLFDPPATLKQVFRFLNLPDWELEDYKKYNVGEYEKMNPTTRSRLIEFYKPYNQKLYDYFGVNFNWEKSFVPCK